MRPSLLLLCAGITTVAAGALRTCDAPRLAPKITQHTALDSPPQQHVSQSGIHKAVPQGLEPGQTSRPYAFLNPTKANPSKMSSLLLLEDLERIQPNDTARFIAFLAHSTNTEISEYAAVGLARIGTSTAVTALLDAANAEPDPEQRANMAEILSTITNREARSVLISALQSTRHSEIARALTHALAKSGSAEMVDALIDAHGLSRDPHSRLRLGITLGSIDNPGASSELMRVAGPPTRPLSGPLAAFALDALARIGTHESADFLLKGLEAASDADQATYLHAIAKISHRSALDALRSAAVSSPSSSVRTAAILALGNYRAGEVMDILEAVRLEPTPMEVRQALDAATLSVTSRREGEETSSRE